MPIGGGSCAGSSSAARTPHFFPKSDGVPFTKDAFNQAVEAYMAKKKEEYDQAWVKSWTRYKEKEEFFKNLQPFVDRYVESSEEEKTKHAGALSQMMIKGRWEFYGDETHGVSRLLDRWRSRLPNLAVPGEMREMKAVSLSKNGKTWV